MRPELRQWLLEGVEPEDQAALLASEPDAAGVLEDYALIDSAAASLDEVPLPEGLAASVLDAVAVTPQDHEIPAPANRPWLLPLLVGAAVAAAALAWVGLSSLPADNLDGDEVWKGGDEPGAEVHLSMSVERAEGQTVRFSAAERYRAGDSLLFRYDVRSATVLHLVRVDADSAELLYTVDVPPGTSDLMTGGSPLGYVLGEGEVPAVFALITHDQSLSPGRVSDALDVGADPTAVCEAAAHLGAFCDARRFEGVEP